jgi:hypothetical protein
MSPKWRWFFPGYLWALPNTLIGLLICIWYRPRSWRWHQGVLTCVAPRERVIGHPGAQTWGWLVIYTHSFYQAGTENNESGLRVHEYVHVAQAFVGGPLFMIAYAITFLVGYFKNPSAGWKPAYRAIPFEVHARKHGDLYATGSGKWGD